MNRITTHLFGLCLLCGCTMPKVVNTTVNEYAFLKVIENGSEAYTREVLGNPTREGEGEVVKFDPPRDAETHFRIDEHCERHNPDRYFYFDGGDESIRLLYSGSNRRLLAAEYCMNDTPIWYTGTRDHNCRSIPVISALIPRNSTPEVDPKVASRIKTLRDFFEQKQAFLGSLEQHQASLRNPGSPSTQTPTPNPPPHPTDKIVPSKLTPFPSDETPSADSEQREEPAKPADVPSDLKPSHDSTAKPPAEPPPAGEPSHAAHGQRTDGDKKPPHGAPQRASLTGKWETSHDARFRIDDDGKTLTIKLIGNSGNVRKVFGKLSRRKGKPDAKLFEGTLDAVFLFDGKQRTLHTIAILDDENDLKFTYSDWPYVVPGRKGPHVVNKPLKEDWARLAVRNGPPEPGQ